MEDEDKNSGKERIMKDFPEFMKSIKNHIDSSQQNTADIDGYYYEGADGGQIAFWTLYADRTSKKHTHEFDEYAVCVYGQCKVYMNGEEIPLDPGDEIFIPKGTEHFEKSVAGTRTIHAFGGKRIINDRTV